MSQGFKLVVLLTLVGVLCGVTAAEAVPSKLASPNAGPTGIEWRPVATEMGLILVVSGPQGLYSRQEFAPGEAAVFSVFDAKGGLRPAGSYVWELRGVPQVDDATRAELQAARESGVEAGVLSKAGKVLAAGVQSGAFAIVDGTILMGGEEEPGASKPAGGARLATKDQVIPDDLIVQGSACIGIDCVNNENFGFDTIRMKENNTRIDFTDTSSTSGFPTQDWEIAANDSASGGRNALIVSDENTQLFVVSSGDSANAIFVDSIGRVGFRTSTPVLDLHVSTSNTPALRLEQTNAGGFTAQTWDVAGNEANFFVRSVTTGSQLPFRIRPGAPTSSVDIAADGDVGIGTASPDAALDIERNGGAAAATLLRLTNFNGPGRLEFRDTTNAIDWDFRTTSGDTFVITQPTSPTNDFQINSAGSVTIRGTLTTAGSCSVGCDRVFSPDYELESIEEHSALMWANSHLPGVGPTPEDGTFNLTEKTGGMLNELEKAHIFIEQLHGTIQTLEARLSEKEGDLLALTDELAAVKAAVEDLQARP